MNKIKEFIREERGVGVVEIILILVILIGLVILFRTTIVKIVTDILGSITNNTSTFK